MVQALRHVRGKTAETSHTQSALQSSNRYEELLCARRYDFASRHVSRFTGRDRLARETLWFRRAVSLHRHNFWQDRGRAAPSIERLHHGACFKGESFDARGTWLQPAEPDDFFRRRGRALSEGKVERYSSRRATARDRLRRTAIRRAGPRRTPLDFFATRQRSESRSM